jgi:hypothetical protein
VRERRLDVLGCADALVRLDQLRQVTDVSDEAERQLFERPRTP